MDTIKLKHTMEQYTEAESREIYDLMLSAGKIIQVTSGGVRVFYKATKFSVEEVYKARKIFPRIDRTERLDSVLDKIYDDSKSDDELKQEIIESVYRPIKREMDEILNDNRNFLADHAAMAKVRKDLNNVIKNLDGLTLNVLNKVLNDDESTFRSNIEFAVYSGLIASVIFGDYKTRSGDKKIVEDVMLIAIIHGTRHGRMSGRMAANFKGKNAKDHYKLDFILDEIVKVEQSKSNIISEILHVAQRYTEILNTGGNEPIHALISLQEEINENTAIAIGALFTKYTIKEYRNRYRHLDDKGKEALAINEEKLRQQIVRRIDRESRIVRKLGEYFLEDLAIKQTFKTGYERVVKFNEFSAALSGIRQNCHNYIERLRSLQGEAYRMLEGLTGKALDVMDIADSEYSLITNTSASSPPDEEIWSSVLAGTRYKEVDFIFGYAAGNLLRFGEKCSQIYRINPKLELRRNFSAINENVMKLKSCLLEDTEDVYDITKVVEIASRKAKNTPEIRIVRAIPSEQISVFIDPFRMEETLSTLIENAVEVIEKRIREQKEGDPKRSRIHYVNVIVKRSGKLCRIKIQDSGGGMSSEVYESIFVRREPFGSTREGTSLLAMQEYLEEIRDADLKVDIKEGIGTTFEITLPALDEASIVTVSTDDIILALHERHWNA